MQTEFSAQRPERLFVQLTDVIVPFGYAKHSVPIKDAILYLGADIEPVVVIRELTESDLQPPTRSAMNRDRFPILNVGECDLHSDGQEGLLVQKLCNISKRSRRLWPARRLWLMTREVTFRPLSQTSSPSTRTPHSRGISLWQTRLGIPGKPLLSIGGSAK